MQNGGRGSTQGIRADPLPPKWQKIAADTAGFVDLPDFGIGREFDGIEPILTKNFTDESIEVFRTGTDDDLIGLNVNATVSAQVTAERFPQLLGASIRGLSQNPFPVV